MSGAHPSCALVTDPSQVLAAWSLVHEVYVEHGHIAPQPQGLYLAPGALHPDTRVFSAALGGSMAATLTAIADSELGLPPDEGFAEELAALRASGDALVFCGQFVRAPIRPSDTPQIEAQRAALSIQLFATMAATLRATGRPLRLLANPVRRHVRYYQRFLGFEQLGPTRTYGRYQVESALMVTDWARLQRAERLPPQVRRALEDPPPPDRSSRGVTTETLAHPRMRAYVHAVWGSASPVWAYAPERNT